MTAQTLSLTLPSPQATCRFAARLGVRLGPGDVLLLTGEIGAGKTHFARCLIQALLTAPEDVPSPTFTLVQTYDAAPCEIWHADLYRLSDADEVEELGLAEAFDCAICLVEWPDRLAETTPEAALSLTFETGLDHDTRVLTLAWSSARWDDLPEALAA